MRLSILLLVLIAIVLNVAAISRAPVMSMSFGLRSPLSSVMMCSSEPDKLSSLLPLVASSRVVYDVPRCSSCGWLFCGDVLDEPFILVDDKSLCSVCADALI